MRKTARVAVLGALLVVLLVGSVASATGSGGGSAQLAAQLADARFATAEYATDLDAAKADGYSLQITPNMPGMGYHFLNPSIGGEFDVTKPPILVYVKRGDQWQLGAFEWVFTERPRTKPLKGARYGSFPAACHYADGNFVPAATETECAATSETGAAFTFWHPRLVTLHVWLWYPNPDGLYAPTNPLVAPLTG